MPRYYVHTKSQPNGSHHVHRAECGFLPEEPQRVFLGFFNRCADALEEAKKHYSDVNGCYYCARDCHRS